MDDRFKSMVDRKRIGCRYKAEKWFQPMTVAGRGEVALGSNHLVVLTGRK
jgi:hypothetical protein